MRRLKKISVAILAASLAAVSVFTPSIGEVYAADEIVAGKTSDDEILFGHYWQEDTNMDNKADSNDEKTPITWKVLEKYDDGTALLLSKYILDKKDYLWGSDYSKKFTWESCDLRKWLNTDFYDSAFTSEDKKAIVTTTIKKSRYK